MNKRITTYKELIEEKERLETSLHDQRLLLRQDIDKIKEELQPVKKVMSVVGKFATRDYSNWMLTTASDTVIDIFLKKTILSKAGWFTRFLIPFLAKNFSSHVVADNKNKLLHKLFSWVGKKSANGKMHTPDPKKDSAVAGEELD